MDAQSRRCTITTCHLHYAHVMCPYKGYFGLLWGIVVDLQAGRDKEHKPVFVCLCVCVCVCVCLCVCVCMRVLGGLSGGWSRLLARPVLAASVPR